MTNFQCSFTHKYVLSPVGAAGHASTMALHPTSSNLPPSPPHSDGLAVPLLTVSVVVCLMLIAVVVAAITVVGVHMWRRIDITNLSSNSMTKGMEAL